MSTQPVPLIILAAGIASRMRASLGDAPGDDPLARQALRDAKGVLAIGEGRRPFLDYLLFNAREAGIRDVRIVVNDRDASVRGIYGERERGNPCHGLSVSYATQRIPPGRDKPLGTADALLQALRAFPGDDAPFVLVCNSDNLYSTASFRALLALDGIGGWIDYDIDCLRYPADRIATFGVTQKDADGFLTGIIEKPDVERLARMRAGEGGVRVTMNIWLLRRDLVLPALEQCPLHPVRGEKELPAAIGAMVAAHPRCMKAVPACEHVPDLTSADDFDAVRDHLRGAYGRDLW